MTMPNFLILGAGKAGTGSLYSYVGQHPDVFTSRVKEPNFFALEGRPLDFASPDAPINRWSITDLDRYRELFAGADGHTAIGEASPLYLYSEEAPQRIHRYLPGARLVVILRDPVERAFSNYLYLVKLGRETLPTFEQALAAEEERIAAHWEWIWHYRSLGYYAQQLERYLRLFDREQLRIYLYDDFKRDPAGLLRDLFAFLGVDPDFAPDTGLRRNVSGIPRSRWLARLLRSDNPVKSGVRALLPDSLRKRVRQRIEHANLSRPQLDPAVRARLASAYRDDVARLRELLDRDLAWLGGA